MKPAALEVKKAQTIEGIEASLDTLLKASGLEYNEPNAPVKNPAFRQYQTLLRIAGKAKMLEGNLPSEVASTASPSAPSSTEQTGQLDAETEIKPDEAPVEEPVITDKVQAEQPKKKSKSK